MPGSATGGRRPSLARSPPGPRSGVLLPHAALLQAAVGHQVGAPARNLPPTRGWTPTNACATIGPCAQSPGPTSPGCGLTPPPPPVSFCLFSVPYPSQPCLTPVPWMSRTADRPSYKRDGMLHNETLFKNSASTFSRRGGFQTRPPAGLRYGWKTTIFSSVISWTA